MALRTLEDDIVAVTRGGASDIDLSGQWAGLMLSYLDAHPEARRDIEALASVKVVDKTMTIGSQHNHGSGTFIGGHNYGDMIFKDHR